MGLGFGWNNENEARIKQLTLSECFFRIDILPAGEASPRIFFFMSVLLDD